MASRERERGADRDERGSKPRGGGGGFSWHPDDATSAGMITGGTWEVERSYFGMFDYGGKRKPAPALIWELVPADGEKGEKQTESWTFGEGWAVSKDGETIEPRNGQTGFGKNTKIIALFDSLIKNGAEELIEAMQASAFEGLVFEAEREERANTARDRDDRGGRGGRGRDRDDDRGAQRKDTFSILLVKDVVTMPGEARPKGKAKGRAKDEDDDEDKPARGRDRDRGRGRDKEGDEEPARGARGGKGRGKDKDEEPEFADDAKEALIEALEKAGGKLAEKDLDKALRKVLKGHDDLDAVVDYATADTFLEQEAGWSYDSKKGTVVIDD